MSSVDNERLQKLLEQGPEAVSKALSNWRIKTLEREKLEAILYTTFKGNGEKRTSDEIKALIRQDNARYHAMLEEIEAETEYTRVNEKHLSNKKIAALLSAF